MITISPNKSLPNSNDPFSDILNADPATLPSFEIPYDTNNGEIFGDEFSSLFKSPILDTETETIPTEGNLLLSFEPPHETLQFDDSWLNNFDFSIPGDTTSAKNLPNINSQYPEIFNPGIPAYPIRYPLFQLPVPNPDIFERQTPGNDVDPSTFDVTLFDDINFWLSTENDISKSNIRSKTDITSRSDTPFSKSSPDITYATSQGSGFSSREDIFQSGLKSLPQRVPGKAWIKTNKLTRGDNMRSTNVSSIPQYSPLPQSPASWGSVQSDGLPLFRYTTYGELYPSAIFSAEHIYEYVFSHPLNLTHLGYYDAHNSLLTLWIGIAPADSARRYATSQSDKCRFNNCPVTHHSITKGTFRVTFDEQHFNDAELDPYNNAGYVHLYCLEKNLDFPTLCRTANIQPDTREFSKEKNKAAITHNNPDFANYVRQYKNLSQPWSKSNPYTYKKTLCYKLTRGQLASESAARKKTRLARDAKMTANGCFSNSLEKHLGNLDVYAANEREKWDQKHQKQVQGKEKPAKLKKRKLTYTSSGDEENDLEATNSNTLQGQFPSEESPQNYISNIDEANDLEAVLGNASQDTSVRERITLEETLYEEGSPGELEADLEQALQDEISQEDFEVLDSPNSLFDDSDVERPPKRLRT